MCQPFLERQIEAIAPEAIITLGKPAISTLMGGPVPITKVRGRWQEWNGFAVMPTFHPAYLLRNYTRDARQAVWDDLTPEQQAKVQEAADAAAESGRKKQLQKEEDLVSFLRDAGLEIYEPDLTAFRKRVQSMYLESEFASTWPDGVLEKINALGN